jgi:hypothetical protein
MDPGHRRAQAAVRSVAGGQVRRDA